jgi:hypothetical protein
MKRFIAVGFVVILIVTLSACTSQPTIELLDSKVSIVSDENIVGATIVNGEKIITTALYYEFTVKNNGKSKIEDMYYEIVPDDNLVTILTDIVGFNVFDPDGYMESGCGYGMRVAPMLKSSEEGNVSLYYDLGVSEENPDIPLVVPSEENLELLINDAYDAYMIVYSEDTEIARFVLKQFNTK